MTPRDFKLLLINVLRRIKGRIDALSFDKNESRHCNSIDPKYWEISRMKQFDFLIKQGLKPDHSVLDIGCGTLLAGIPLIKYLNKGLYVGIDSRVDVINEAEHEAAEHNLLHKEPQLIHGSGPSSVAHLNLRPDLVWAFFVIFLMNDKEVDDWFKYIAHTLKPGGVFMMNSSDELSEALKWRGFRVQARPFNFYRSLAEKYHLDIENLGTLKQLGFAGLPTRKKTHYILKFLKSEG